MKKLHFFLSFVSSPVLCSSLSLLDACRTMRSEGTVHYWECVLPHWLHTLRGVCECVCFCACRLLQALWSVALLGATFFISLACFSCAWFTVYNHSHRVDSHSTLQVVVVPLRVSLSTLGFSVTPPWWLPSRDEVADSEVSALVCSLLLCVPSPSCG